jgi:hypothetical protein
MMLLMMMMMMMTTTTTLSTTMMMTTTTMTTQLSQLLQTMLHLPSRHRPARVHHLIHGPRQ